MDRNLAKRISQVTREASGLLDESVVSVGEGCSDKAAGVYRSAVGRIMGEMAAGLLFPIWREHPELEPEPMKEPGAYDPREFEMPPKIAQEALGALTKARELMLQVAALLQEEPNSSERQVYSKELDAVFEELARAMRGVEKRTTSP